MMLRRKGESSGRGGPHFYPKRQLTALSPRRSSVLDSPLFPSSSQPPRQLVLHMLRPPSLPPPHSNLPGASPPCLLIFIFPELPHPPLLINLFFPMYSIVSYQCSPSLSPSSVPPLTHYPVSSPRAALSPAAIKALLLCALISLQPPSSLIRRSFRDGGRRGGEAGTLGGVFSLGGCARAAGVGDLLDWAIREGSVVFGHEAYDATAPKPEAHAEEGIPARGGERICMPEDSKLRFDRCIVRRYKQMLHSQQW